MLIIPATKRLLSKSKQNDPEQLKEYLKLHQRADLELKELTNYLKSKKQQILAIVYCRREGTPDLFCQLLGTGVLIIPATKRLHSKSKQNDPEQLKENLKLHQSAYLELKSLRLVVAYKERLSELIGNIRGKQQRPSQTRRKAKSRREQKLKAAEVSALQ